MVLAVAIGTLVSIPSPAAGGRQATALAPVQPSPGPCPDKPPGGKTANVTRVLDRLAELRSKLPRAELDVSARAAQLGSDPTRLLAFVREEVATEVYPGALRGARGTLLGRAGNAFDKSLLLAALLRCHGHEVRFATGELDDTAATRLVRQVAARSGPRRELKGVELPVALKPWAEPLMVELRAAVRANARDRAALEKALPGAWKKRSALPLTPDGLVKQARQHCWVEVRRKGRWVALDPSFAGSRVGDRPVKPAAVGAALPARLYQTVTFCVRIEYAIGKELKTRTALEKTYRAADLVGTPILFVNVPNLRGGKADPVALNKVTRFLPLLRVGGKDVFHKAFDLHGQEVAPEAFLAGPAAAMARVGDSLRDALSMRKASVPKTVLTAEWLEFVLRTPGEPDRIFPREVLDRIGPAGRGPKGDRTVRPEYRDERRVRRLLLGERHLWVEPVCVGHTFAADAAAAQWLAQRDLLRAGGGKIDPKRWAAASRPDLCLPLLALSVVTHSLGGRLLADDFPKAHFYRAAPALMMYKVAPDLRNDGKPVLRVGFDVISDSWCVVAGGGDTSRRAALALGLLQTRLELVLARWLHPSAGPRPGQAAVRNTLPALAAARRAGIPLVCLVPGDTATLARLRVSEEARARMAGELAEGNVVLTLARAVPGLGTAWWRIDPVRGSALGVIESGEGAGIIEYLNTLSIALWVSFAPVMGEILHVLGVATAILGVSEALLGQLTGDRALFERGVSWGLLGYFLSGVSGGLPRLGPPPPTLTPKAHGADMFPEVRKYLSSLPPDQGLRASWFDSFRQQISQADPGWVCSPPGTLPDGSIMFAGDRFALIIGLDGQIYSGPTAAGGFNIFAPPYGLKPWK
jgi:transglutaminase-like putative cysteine protease